MFSTLGIIVKPVNDHKHDGHLHEVSQVLWKWSPRSAGHQARHHCLWHNWSAIQHKWLITIHGFAMYLPETVSQKGASMVEVKGNVARHLLQGGDLLTGEVFGYDCLCLGSDVQVSNGTNRNRDKGVDAPEAKISILVTTHLSLKVMS